MAYRGMYRLDKNLNQCCSVDMLPLASHPRCRSCAILSGPGHLTEGLVGGYCDSCAAARQRLHCSRPVPTD